MPADLGDLGLVDPQTGEAVQTQETPSGYEPEYTVAREFPEEAQAHNWDDDQNPWKQKYERIEREARESTPPIGQQLAQREAQIATWANEAHAKLVQQGFPAETAQALVEPYYKAYLAEERLQATRAATLPLVTEKAIRDIASEFSDKKAGVVVNPDELQGLASVEAMRARAKALQDERRDRAFKSRREESVDRAEGRAPATGQNRDPANMSPFQTIKRGLELGHL